ncbi:hypothetical protein CMT42_03535 [Elizabethkingia anophelis]|uniref:Uncharacterized protein n=2 Tax=Bacteroidota TaxID=976 RepID=A0ACD5C6Y8_9SPHI|nr:MULTISPECIES: hypothetical protein [Flavobacteriales]OJU76699.1 MAG: hypothetical protein BGO09_08905 [Bacteroidetes bacterium 47-18]MDV3875047.1 hypothetical protein [Elizabethkingia anophelis]MDV3892885.1 hypothetical protein [Elizabethkingia anophelis]MDV3916446.1 hypothetical protein [Elizabethkingia anophelis]MDV3919382.1 hypothetical protein [Elizabethkingia anophelis]
MDRTYYPISLIADKLQLEEVASQYSNEEQFEVLARYLDGLIQSDFNKLLSILYHIDVSEEKVKKALAENKDKLPAGQIIAALLIERENEKIKLRAKYSKK